MSRMARLTSYGPASTWTHTGAAILVALLCCIVQISNAKSIDVGGKAGWTIFESSQVTAPNYGAWASSQKFFVGDSLVFKFAAGAHNVWLLKSQAAFQICDFSGAMLLDEGNSGYYTWTATQPGGFYFSCDKGAEGVGTHCDYNQKLAIFVSKTATTPISAPSPAPYKAPPPSPYTTSPSPPPTPMPLPPSPTLRPPSPLLRPPSPLPMLLPPAPLPLPPSPPGFTAPAPAQSPIAKGPIHAPAPSYAPWIAPVAVPAHFPSLPPTEPPNLSPFSSPVTSPSSVPAPAPVFTISPVPSPFVSPISGPTVASTPLALTPDMSSPPSPDLPKVPGSVPASDSPVPNAGVMLSAQSWSSLVHSVILLCLLLW
ncbi:hypothetical protein M758_7G081200 [Ceratodon purpureus]|nr:hypothetical protein M758_7G081200 [Ceratodon purpureus]KAG0610646.1 hypothetical protein M758_7G081200 [Ceratodon purpureus]